MQEHILGNEMCLRVVNQNLSSSYQITFTSGIVEKTIMPG